MGRFVAQFDCPINVSGVPYIPFGVPIHFHSHMDEWGTTVLKGKGREAKRF